MKEILFKKTMDPEQRMKNFSVKTTRDEKESRTEVEKAFRYQVVEVEKVDEEIQAPQINIKKEINNKEKTEKFYLDVQGYFFMTKERMLIKVCFHHTLNIQIKWKDKIFSPKKSEVLTE